MGKTALNQYFLLFLYRDKNLKICLMAQKYSHETLSDRLTQDMWGE